MKRLVPLLAFALGAVVLGLMVRHTGIAPLVEAMTRSGWALVGLVAIWGVTYLANARAWQLLVPRRPAGFTLWRAYLLTVTGFGINFLTPLMSMGGEPIKIAGAMRWLGREQAAGSVVGFRLLHSLAHAIVFILAAIPAAILLPRTWLSWSIIALVTLIMSAISLFLLSGHHEGLFVRAVARLGRVRLLRGAAARLQKQRRVLRELDRELTAIRRDSPRQFAHALVVELIGRLISTAEFTVMLYALGLPADPWQGFVIANVSSLFTVTFFFIPFEMGAKEGGVYLVMKLLGHDPVLGASAALLSRVRELFWGAASLLILLRLDLRNPLAAHPPPAPECD